MDDIIASVSSSGDVRYFLHDHLGSTVGVMDESGGMIQEYAYGVFGEVYVKSGSGGFVDARGMSGGLVTSRLFTGREYDAETGLYYYRARTYDAALGRFLQRDPIGTDDQVNMYTYVRNNPMKWVDPSGKEKVLLKIVDIFNKYGSAFDYARAGSSSYNLGYNPDYDPALNALYIWTSVSSEANLKVNDDIRKDSAWIDPINCNSGSKCGKKIVIDGHDIWLADLGNLLYGLNGYRAGFSYDYIQNGAMKVTQAGSIDSDKSEGVYANEINDQPFYKAGYALGQKETITKEDILNALSGVIQGNKTYQYRKGW